VNGVRRGRKKVTLWEGVKNASHGRGKRSFVKTMFLEGQVTSGGLIDLALGKARNKKN